MYAEAEAAEKIIASFIAEEEGVLERLSSSYQARSKDVLELLEAEGWHGGPKLPAGKQKIRNYGVGSAGTQGLLSKLKPGFREIIEFAEESVGHIRKADLKELLKDPNKMRHVFSKVKHNLHLLKGNPISIVEEALHKVIKLDKEGLLKLFSSPQQQLKFYEAVVTIQGYEVRVAGRIMEGELKLGTMYIS